MLKSPEQFYEQHRKDAERVEKAQSVYEKHLEQARTAGDLFKHPELWDQASAEYRAETQEKIAEAAKSGNIDVAEELIRGLRVHLETNKKIEEGERRGGLEETVSLSETEQETAEVIPEEEIRRMVPEADWQYAKDRAFKILQSVPWSKYAAYAMSQLAEMRKFDPQRFDKEVTIDDHLWQRFMEEVESAEHHPECYLLAACDLKNLNPKLFDEQFWNRMDDEQKEKKWARIMGKIRQSKDNPQDFLFLASAVKDLDPERFQREISENEEFTKVIWPRIVNEVERMKKENPHDFLMHASHAQNIKPESEPDITINEQTWNKVKKVLEDELRASGFRKFFAMANDVSRLKVEKK